MSQGFTNSTFPTKQQVQASAFNQGVDTGVADAYIVNLSPVVGTLTDGLIVKFTPLNTNVTSAPTLQINANSAVPIYIPNVSFPAPGDLVTYISAELIYSSGLGGFILLNPAVSSVSPSNLQNATFNFATDSGAADAYVVNLFPAVTTLQNGQIFSFTTSNGSTGTVIPTLDINGLGALNIKVFGTQLGFTNVIANDIAPTIPAIVQYFANGNEFLLLNPQRQEITSYALQYSIFTSIIDTGAANAYTGTTAPPLPTYQFFLTISFLCENNNTGPSTLDVSSLGPLPILDTNGNALVGGEMVTGATYFLTNYGNASHWTLMTPSITHSSSIIGTQTNDNANAGFIGEYVSSSVLAGSAVSLSTGTTANITSISLDAGDWDVNGTVFFDPAASTTSQYQTCGISKTSATYEVAAADNNVSNAGGASGSLGAGYGAVLPVGSYRASLATTTTIYLLASSVFAISTINAYGFISARRVR